jgi:hypothetical protein
MKTRQVMSNTQRNNICTISRAFMVLSYARFMSSLTKAMMPRTAIVVIATPDNSWIAVISISLSDKFYDGQSERSKDNDCCQSRNHKVIGTLAAFDNRYVIVEADCQQAKYQR